MIELRIRIRCDRCPESFGRVIVMDALDPAFVAEAFAIVAEIMREHRWERRAGMRGSEVNYCPQCSLTYHAEKLRERRERR